MLALGFVARGHNEAFAECIECGPSSAVNQLVPFCRPPFASVANIPSIAHVAARSTKPRTGPDVPADMKEAVGDVIAKLMEPLKEEAGRKGGVTKAGAMMVEFMQRFQSSLVDHSKDQTEYLNPTDLGTELGLILAGVLKFVAKERDVVSKRVDIAMLAVAVIMGALSNVPKAEKALGAAEPLVDAVMDRIKTRKLKPYDAVLEEILYRVYASIDDPIENEGFKFLPFNHAGKKVRIPLEGDGRDVSRAIDRVLIANKLIVEGQRAAVVKASIGGK